MSRRRELDQHRRQLGEIAEIMRSMKNLAYMETRKLSRLLEAQGAALAVIESAAGDFGGFHPNLVTPAAAPCRVVLLIGSERGFCGDFNEDLLRVGMAERASGARIIAVGSRLCGRLQEDGSGMTVLLEGPGVVEEVTGALNRLLRVIGRLQEEQAEIGLCVRYHRDSSPALEQRALLPPLVTGRSATGPRFGAAPLLTLAPEQFFGELVEQYLLAALQEIFYASLMAENQRRIQHLEAAVRRLDDKAAEYARQCRILRQEEITEEIEVILLSAEGMDAMPGVDRPDRGA